MSIYRATKYNRIVHIFGGYHFISFESQGISDIATLILIRNNRKNTYYRLQ